MKSVFRQLRTFCHSGQQGRRGRPQTPGKTWSSSDWLAKFNEGSSAADPFWKGKFRHSRKNEKRRGVEWRRGRSGRLGAAPKSASRTWVKFEIGPSPPLLPSAVGWAPLSLPPVPISLSHACYLRSRWFHRCAPFTRPCSPTSPPSSSLARPLAELSLREYSYRAPEIGEARHGEGKEVS